MARRSWTGLRRPTENAVLRREALRMRRRNDPPAEWWRMWNAMDDKWARERADEDAKARRLLNFLLSSGDDDDERKARRLAEALGLLKDTLKNGGEQ